MSTDMQNIKVNNTSGQTESDISLEMREESGFYITELLINGKVPEVNYEGVDMDASIKSKVRFTESESVMQAIKDYIRIALDISENEATETLETLLASTTAKEKQEKLSQHIMLTTKPTVKKVEHEVKFETWLNNISGEWVTSITIDGKEFPPVSHITSLQITDEPRDKKCFYGRLNTVLGTETKISRGILYNINEQAKQITSFAEIEQLYKEKKAAEDEADKENETENEPVETREKRIVIKFDIVGDTILRERNFFTTRDTQEFYIYRNGVYVNKDTEPVMKKIIRDTYKRLYSQQYLEVNGKVPEYIEEPNKAYTAEVLEKLRIDKSVSREWIDKNQIVNKYLINLKNCVYDISTGEIQDHNPKFFFIRQIPVDYDPKATCPQIMKFFKDTVSDEDARVLIECAGYYMIPDTRIQKTLLVYGKGSNGKSKYIGILDAFLGRENVNHDSLDEIENGQYTLADIYGKLLNVAADIEGDQLTHTDKFRKITGGDILKANQKYLRRFEFENTARMLFSANIDNIPSPKKIDFAFLRRWMMIKFFGLFLEEGEKKENENSKADDKDILAKMTTPEELSGFLNIALEGLKRVLRNQKFSYNKTIEEVAEIYKLNSSSVRAFAENCLVAFEEDSEIFAVHKDYESWAESKKVKVVALNIFSKELRNLGYVTDRYYDENSKTKKTYLVNFKVDEEKLLYEMTGIKAEMELKQEQTTQSQTEQTVQSVPSSFTEMYL